jgi:hypothetical protein
MQEFTPECSNSSEVWTIYGATLPEHVILNAAFQREGSALAFLTPSFHRVSLGLVTFSGYVRKTEHSTT